MRAVTARAGRRVAWVVLWLVAGSGCASRPPAPATPAAGCANSAWKQGKAAREFERQTPEHRSELEGAMASGAAAPTSISEIALTRSECGGPCPSYSIELAADGTATYVGHSCVERLGERRGRLEPWRFERLARLAEDIGFFDLSFAYSSTVTDQAATFILVVREDERKVVMSYGEAGPPRLWAFEEAIAGTLEHVRWEDE